ncbi:MAG: class II aldolase/adducin family protein [Bacteroidetes bacterium]|nr:class II aldolase/adducin family protein [Bacteroidota bacterium]
MDAKLLSLCFHDLYQAGLTTASGGNISCRQTDGLICISPSQIDKGYLKPQDFALLNFDGVQVGNNKPSMEYPFHLSLYRKFPHIKTVVHIHPLVFVALSLLSKNDYELKGISEKFNFGYADYAIPGSDLLGSNICKAFKDNVDVVLMQNHGVIAIGTELNVVIERIVELNQAIIKHFNLGSIVDKFSLTGKLNLKSENTSRFYEERTKHFLSIKNEVKFVEYNKRGLFTTAVQFQSLKLGSHSAFSTHIIPESYLILKDPLFQNKKFNKAQIDVYLKLFDEQIKVLIFNDGWALISGTSLYNLYDKMEVLDFTAKVILIALKMGQIDLLSDSQILKLKEKFL